MKKNEKQPAALTSFPINTLWFYFLSFEGNNKPMLIHHRQPGVCNPQDGTANVWSGEQEAHVLHTAPKIENLFSTL